MSLSSPRITIPIFKPKHVMQIILTQKKTIYTKKKVMVITKDLTQMITLFLLIKVTTTIFLE